MGSAEESSRVRTPQASISHLNRCVDEFLGTADATMARDRHHHL